ncbi:MAG: hypothetical protein WDZ91_15825 [Paenibacillaceae bacterium]
MSKVSKTVNNTLKTIQLPAGVTYSLGGITEQVRGGVWHQFLY